MEIRITGEPKEIAALVLEIQERREEKFVPETSDGPCCGGINVKTTSCL